MRADGVGDGRAARRCVAAGVADGLLAAGAAAGEWQADRLQASATAVAAPNKVAVIFIVGRPQEPLALARAPG